MHLDFESPRLTAFYSRRPHRGAGGYCFETCCWCSLWPHCIRWQEAYSVFLSFSQPRASASDTQGQKQLQVLLNLTIPCTPHSKYIGAQLAVLPHPTPHTNKAANGTSCIMHHHHHQHHDRHHHYHRQSLHEPGWAEKAIGFATCIRYVPAAQLYSCGNETTSKNMQCQTGPSLGKAHLTATIKRINDSSPYVPGSFDKPQLNCRGTGGDGIQSAFMPGVLQSNV